MGRKEKKPKKEKQHRPSVLAKWWRGIDPAKRHAFFRGTATAVFVSAMGIGVIWIARNLQRHVLAMDQAPALAAQVRLTQWPWWMPLPVVRDVAYSLTPRGTTFNDPAVVDEVYRAALANPWIRGGEPNEQPLVTKIRGDNPDYGIIQVDARFRRPVAKVKVPGQAQEEFVDADGVRLPAEQAPRWIASLAPSGGAGARQICFVDVKDVPSGVQAAPIHYVRIDGVQAAPPPVGQKWPGADLAAGIRLAGLVADRPYFRQIVAIDERNYDGRLSKQAPAQVMYAATPGSGKATEIRLEAFPREEGDFRIAPEQGLLNLDVYYKMRGTLAGISRYIDLRGDQLYVSRN